MPQVAIVDKPSLLCPLACDHPGHVSGDRPSVLDPMRLSRFSRGAQGVGSASHRGVGVIAAVPGLPKSCSDALPGPPPQPGPIRPAGGGLLGGSAGGFVSLLLPWFSLSCSANDRRRSLTPGGSGIRPHPPGGPVAPSDAPPLRLSLRGKARRRSVPEPASGEGSAQGTCRLQCADFRSSHFLIQSAAQVAAKSEWSVTSTFKSHWRVFHMDFSALTAAVSASHVPDHVVASQVSCDFSNLHDQFVSGQLLAIST